MPTGAGQKAEVQSPFVVPWVHLVSGALGGRQSLRAGLTLNGFNHQDAKNAKGD